MNISLKWLKDYIDVNLDNVSLVEKLNLMSAEVARLEKLVDASKLTIGFVEESVKHPDADKLHICAVDTGTEKLQIICGAPNVAKGQKVIVALDGAVLPGNFKIRKAKIRNVESNGMICSLEELGIDRKYHQEDGIHVLPSDAPLGGDPLRYLHFDDHIIELDLTPNRADLMSHIGVAYDIKAITNGEVHIASPQVEEESDKNPVSVFTETAECMSYYARVIRNILIGPSPVWMQSRLIACGVRPINNVVDITNYVMLECGQPLHAFDYDKIGSNQIIVRNARKHETMVTLDGKTRALETTDIVITDGKRPIALAGVMGGAETEVDATTGTILLEAATFDPICVRKTSKRLDLRSESSQRFERGLDPARTRWAADRAAELFTKYCQGEVLKGINYFDVNTLGDRIVPVSLETIHKVTGYHYSINDIEDVFSRLSFKCHFSDGDFQVHVPSRRQDLRTYQDLIEEIVRIHGYYHIPLTLPKTVTLGKLSEVQKLRREVRQLLLAFGLDETVTYSLVNEKEAVMFDASKRDVVKILNPLSEEKACLRHSQIPSLLGVLVYNQARKFNDVSIFEIGKGYFADKETELLTCVMSGEYRPLPWQHETKTVDFYLLKGIVVSTLENLGIRDVSIEKSAQYLASMHPGICADILVGKNPVGFIGRLHPELEHTMGIKDVFVAEIELESVFRKAEKPIVMETISKYPPVSRDLALVVMKSLPAETLVQSIWKSGSSALREVEIFDIYEGEKIGRDAKSVALKLVFQDDQKTLSTEEVDKFVTKILKHVEKNHQATLRSLN